MSAWYRTQVYMETLIINCDLGENEADALTTDLVGQIDAANICCGVHAGNRVKTEQTLRQAAEAACLIGAHPGLPSAGGRGTDCPSPAAFADLLERQLESFLLLAGKHQIAVHHVKLHGSLYHFVEAEPALAEVYLSKVAALGIPHIFTLSGGAVESLAKTTSVCAYRELFVDRAYHRDGRLVSRQIPGAVLGPDVAILRLQRWLESGLMETIEGERISLKGETFE